MIPIITSTSNPKIKWVKSLQKNSTRKDEGVFVVEGAKEVGFAVDNEFLLHSIFVCPDIYGQVPSFGDNIEIYSINKNCYEKIAYRGSTDGIIAVFHNKIKKLDDLTMGETPFFIVVESIEKPGNLGAIIRTADGAGADGVIVCDEKVDIYNPNVIRASVGTVFSTQVVSTDVKSLLDFLNKHEITSYGAILSDNSTKYSESDFTKPTAIILGDEHKGLSSIWHNNSEPIQIPMLGSNDSLNVSNAAAILAYEVIRQRKSTSE
ncbi:RNA methyltransferase [Candidatus Nomurabacteria bacterium]|nr:RNA methyltransferase [Candidatus Nomurabacteria bacterium]